MACDVNDGVFPVPSIAAVDAPVFVLKRKFRTNAPVKGLFEYTNGLSVVFRFTVPDFMTDTVFALLRASTVVGALETRERLLFVNEPVGPCAGVILMDTESVGAILSIRTAG